MQDSQTTVAMLRSLVADFVNERDWRQFHSPKNLAMSISIEAAELMEHVQWLTVEQIRAVVDDHDKRLQMGEELADVIAYCLAMANELQLDVSDALSRKMQKNAVKYPADEFRGRYGLEDSGQ